MTMTLLGFLTIFIFSLSHLTQGQRNWHPQFSKTYNGGKCTPNKKGTYRIAFQYCDGTDWLTMYPGRSKGNKMLGKSCLDIKHKGLSRGDGEYLIDPDGGNAANAFRAYCDMTSFGGGWTMCYTTDNHVDIKKQVSSKFPYGTDGYRANCNKIPFTEVMFVDEKSKQKAAFAKSGPAITFHGNYDKSAGTYGLWTSHGVATKQYKYQLLICDTSFYKGLHVSGYTKCYKQCGNWCGDTKSPYFRTAAVSSPSYRGVAFNVNGHSPKSPRLISAGVR